MLSTSSHLSGLVQLDTNTISISDLSFFLASSDINQLAENYGHRFGSDIQGQGIGGAFELACIRALSGQLDWTGGRLSIDTGGGCDRTTDSGARGRIKRQRLWCLCLFERCRAIRRDGRSLT